jgi:hypothetical protein
MDNLTNKILNIASTYSSPIISKFEKPKIEHYASLKEKHQPIFIIGAPRTGSTILYQTLTNTFDVLYPDNLVNKFYKNFYFGFWLSDIVFHQKPHNCFSSYHGATKGLRSPNECGAFWYRWLPKERHYIKKNEVSEQSIKEIRNNIFSVINRFNNPLLFKNMNAGQRLEIIYEIAPNCKIIFIRRNPLFTAQSIYKVRLKVNNSPNRWWSIMPPNYNELLKLSYHEQIVKQIFFIEKQITQDLKFFPPDNIFKLNYKNFCINHEKCIKKIYNFMGPKISLRKNRLTNRISYSEKKVINTEEIKNFQREIDKLDWLNYNI